MLHHGTPRLIDHTVETISVSEGDLTLAALRTALGLASDDTVNDKVVSMGKDGNRLVRLVAEACTATASEDDTLDYELYAGQWIRSGNDTVGATLFKIAGGTATIGTKAGIAGGSPVDNTYTFADAITLTQADYHTDLQAAFGSSVPKVHSPGSNGVARVIVDELGPADFVVIPSETGLLWRVTAIV